MQPAYRVDGLAGALNERLRHTPITVADFSRGLDIPLGGTKNLATTIRFSELGFTGSTLTGIAEICPIVDNP